MNASCLPLPRTSGRWLRRWVALAGAVGVIGAFGLSRLTADTTPPPVRTGTGFSYQHDQVTRQPWSIHIARFSRSRTNFLFRTTLAADSAIGLATVSEQMAHLPRSLGRAMVAVNGDYFVREGAYRGDPEGLLIVDGEVISAPSAKSCFWMDPSGEPHITNVMSGFTVSLPGGETLPVGLNEELTDERPVLYSAAIGGSTHTGPCREFVLEREGEKNWLPLRPGGEYFARVREVRDRGDAPLGTNTVILSVPHALDRRVSGLTAGASLRLALRTVPDLTGVRTAIGGGPALLHDGKRAAYRSEAVRHPRTALGWNKEDFFLVQVDGRQPSLSVGMTLPELSDYLQKLGCLEALNLDGGGSSTMWIDGQVMNNPCEGAERPTGTTLVVLMTLDFRAARTNAPPR